MRKLKPTTPGAQRLLTARDAAAKELGLPVEDWLVKRYSVLMAAHDSVEAELAVGRGNIDHLLKISEQMTAVRASVPPKPTKVRIGFVEGVSGTYRCQHCHQWNTLKEGRYTPAVPDKSKPAAEVKSQPPTDDAAKPAAVQAAPAQQPVDKPKRSPKWAGEPGKEYMPAVDHTKGNEGFVKRTLWSGSHAMLGAHGGAVRGNGKLAGTPDHGPAPSVEGGKP